MLAAHEAIEVGDHVMFANHCFVGDADHRYDDPELPVTWQGFVSRGPVRIGSNIWLGKGVVVTGGTEIGEHSVIGSNSVVTRDTPPWTISAGAPAKVLSEIEPRPVETASLSGVKQRITAIVLVAALLALLGAGCGEKDEPPTTGPVVAETTTGSTTSPTTTNDTTNGRQATDEELIRATVADFLSSRTTPASATSCHGEVPRGLLRRRQGCIARASREPSADRRRSSHRKPVPATWPRSSPSSRRAASSPAQT